MSVMSLRDSLARYRDKWKKRLHFGSRSASPTPPDTDHKPSRSAPKPQGQHGTAGMTWSGVRTLLQVLESSSDAFGPLKSAIGRLNKCIDIYECAAKGRKDYIELQEKLNELLGDLAGQMDKPMDAMMTHSVKLLCAGITAELKIVEEKQARNLGQRLAEVVDTHEEILECYRRIQGHVQRLTLNANMTILKVVNDIQMEARMNRLSPAAAAVYNSTEAHDIGRRACTPDTRQPQIDLLLLWANESDSGRTCWINGMAGTGKTTIAFSVCSALEKRSTLGASFFCSRSIPECRQVKYIIPTIAYQLARYSTPFRYALQNILEAEPDVSGRALNIQYEKLIVEPLKAVQNSMPTDFVVVVDALDECENANSLGEILNLLLSTPDTLPIRFLLSSRPEPEISRRMKDRGSKQCNTLLVLHDLDTEAVRSDVELFMKQELQDIPISEDQWSGLLERCGVLFIYASTTCRFIRNGHHSGFLNEAVDSIIGSGPEYMDAGDERTIDELYATILRAALGEKSEITQRNKRRMQNVVETVLCAAEPMQLATIADLLELGNAQKVEGLLQPLRSVLNISGDSESQVVTALHASFPDFMFDLGRSREFHCERERRELALANGCLRIMDAIEPKFNVCGLSSSHMLDHAIEDLDEKVKYAISPGLAYASRYWSSHLLLGGYEDDLVETVRKFLSRRLLIWMEILNLTKRMRFGVIISQQAERWCLSRGVAEDLVKLARDASQFVSVYANHPVSQSTPHIYVSMLPFWPSSRPVSTTYMPRTTGMIKPKGAAIHRRQPALLATWRVASYYVSFISLSKDGTRIVAASDQTIIMLHASTGEETLHFQEPQTNGVCTVAMSPDGSRVAFGSDNGAYLLEVASGQIAELCPEQISEVLCVAFSYDGSRTAVGTPNGSVFICRTQQADLVLGPLEGHTDSVRSVSFSPDSRHLASGSDDKAIRIRDTKNGQMVGDPLHGHTDRVLSVSYSRDGTHLASSSADRTIRVWDPQTGQTVLGPLEAHSDWVRSVTFSPDGAFIASGSDDTTIRVYDAQTGQPVLGPLHGHTGVVYSVVFSPDGARLFSCSSDGTIRLWNVQDRDVPTASHAAAPSDLVSVRYSHDGLRAVSGSQDGTVGVWDVQTGEMVLGPLEGHTTAVSGVDYSPGGAYIASASWDSTLRIWSAEDGKDMHGPLQGHTRNVNCVRFSPDSSLVVSGSDDTTVRVWDVKTGQPVAEPLQGHSGWVRSVAFSPNGSHLACGSDDRIIRVWDIHTGQTVIEPLEGHESYVMSVEFSPDGSRILSGSSDKSIRTWDAVTGQPLLVLGKDLEYINSAGFSADGRLVVSGSLDGTVCVWDAQSGDLILALEGHIGWVFDVQFSPDGSHVVSSSGDGTIRFWDVSSCRAYLEDESTKDDGETKGSSQIAALSRAWTVKKDGWVVDRQGQRLVWVPSDLQNYIQHPLNRLVIGDKRYVKLEFEDTNIGDRWTRCYSP